MPLVLPAAPPALPFAGPSLAEALARLRQDIFDQVGADPAAGTRWQDGDLQRALDRALDRYSFVAPWLQTALLPAIAGRRLYAIPAAAGGPAWWVESVEYPMGQYPRSFVPYGELAQPALGAPPAPLASAPGAGPIAGLYRYRVTFLGIASESAAGAPCAPVAGPGSGVSLTLPLGPEPYCAGRAVYRTQANGEDGAQRLVATIADNTTTAFIDAAPDAALGAPMPAADSTQNAPLLELRIPDSLLPGVVAPGSLAVTYAARHVWAANGATIPEQHQDVVLLGAAAYACLAYQVPTNDLFEYQDGELRDRVSEVKTPEHWLAAGTALLARFEARLEDVKRQRDAGAAAVAQWGSVPARWQWT
jgi:hypothetical protein